MDNTTQNTSTNAPVEKPAPQACKKPVGLIAVTVICAVLAVGGIGFGVYEFMNSNQKNQQISDLKVDIEKKDSKIAELENTVSSFQTITEVTTTTPETTETEPTTTETAAGTAAVLLGNVLDDNGTRVAYKIGDCTADGPSVKCPVIVDGKEGLVSHNSNDSILRLVIPKN